MDMALNAIRNLATSSCRVKEETQESEGSRGSMDAQMPDASAQPRSPLNSTMLDDILRSVKGRSGFRMLDPAQEGMAEQRWQSCLQWFEITDLRLRQAARG